MRVEKIPMEFKEQKKNKPCKEYFTGCGMKRNQKHEKSKRKVNPVRSCIQIKGRNNKKESTLQTNLSRSIADQNV